MDSLLKARAGTTAHAAVGFRTSSVDVADRWKVSTGGDQLSFDAGFRDHGTDFRYIFRDISFVEVSAPTITSNPSGHSANEGVGFTLSVGASGTATLTYQWRKNGSNISGATSATFTNTSPVYTDSGSYDCVVSNSYGSATSSAATVTVYRPVSITTHPSNITGNYGTGSLSFTCAAVGDGTLTYAWYSLVSGFIGYGSTINLTGETLDFAGDQSYYCEVSSSLGTSASSNTASRTTNVRLAFDYEPAGQSHVTGDYLRLFVLITADGTAGFQWYLDGNPIPGETYYELIRTNLNHGDEGSYTCEISDASSGSHGTQTSAGAYVSVGSSLSIYSQPSNVDNDDGDGAQAVAVGATSAGSLSYQWVKNGSPMGGATGYQHVMNPCSSNPDFGDYYCQVSDSYGDSINSNSAHVWPKPIIDSGPYDATGAGFSWSNGVGPFGVKIDAHSSAGVSHQWYRDGTPLGTSDQHVVNPATPGDAGEYWCVITDGNGLSRESGHVHVSVS